MLTDIVKVLIDEDGATLVEYALIVSLVGVACIVVITSVTTQIRNAFSNIGTKLGAA